MEKIDLKYGHSQIAFEFDKDRFEVLGRRETEHPLADIEIGARFDSPIDSPPLEDIVKPGETVLLVVPDATRETASGQIVNLLVRRLIANGTTPAEISAIFATGIHRPVTEEEKQQIVTPFIAQRLKTITHDAGKAFRLFRVGEISGGIPVELNWTLTEYDHVILIGGINFHYFAGFTGGRKLICPGLASAKTIAATHKLAFDCSTKTRRDGVGTAQLDGNAVHEAFVEAAAMIDPSFCISTIVNDAGEVVDLYCGDWRTSHRAACDAYSEAHTIKIPEKRPLVIASCGGYPHDINMIQAHKALDAASHACAEGGTIVLIAECADGLGRSDFLDWFEAENSAALAEKLCEDYQVNGQTAWSLLRKAESFNIKLISDLPDADLARLRLSRAGSLPDAVGGSEKGYIVPFGARFRLAVDQETDR